MFVAFDLFIIIDLLYNNLINFVKNNDKNFNSVYFENKCHPQTICLKLNTILIAL